MKSRSVRKVLVRFRRVWGRFIRLQRESVTTKQGVLFLIALGAFVGFGGVELHVAGALDDTWLRLSVYFVLLGAGSSFWFLFRHYRYASTLAHQDVLTGLSNRKAILSAFTKFQSLAQREQRKLAVLYMDLDSFKPVNDQYGHDAGDELLRRLAAVLQMAVRESDIVARIGGDEFLILMTGSVTAEGVARCVERLHEAIQRPIRMYSAGDITIKVSASIGVAVYPDDGHDVRSLSEIADRRMFEAKRCHHGGDK